MTRNAGARLPIEGLHIPRPSFGDFSVRKRYSKWCANVDPALFQKAGSAESGAARLEAVFQNMQELITGNSQISGGSTGALPARRNDRSSNPKGSY